jgi:hypothetical protein
VNGVTASFNASSTMDTSTLTVSASSIAKSGKFSVRILGKSPGLSHTVTISLAVTP